MGKQTSVLCKVCREEPEVFNGFCATCISGDEKDPSSGKFHLRHAPRRKKKPRNQEVEN